MVGAAAFAGTIPRVYQYSATLNATVAKNASKVKYWDDAEDKYAYITDGVCYRTKGKVSVKGVIVYGCSCNQLSGSNWGGMLGFERQLFQEWDKEDENWADTLDAGYPLVLMATSIDKYSQVVFVGEMDDEGAYWANYEAAYASRFGSPISTSAKYAELGFEFWFWTGGEDNGCARFFDLQNAGFGTASLIDRTDGTLDITSISGNVVGETTAPFCTADDNNCPRCLNDDECDLAISFAPCADLTNDGFGEGVAAGVSPNFDLTYGTFSFKFNKTLSNLIRNVDAEDIQGTINALVPKAFGKKAIAPVIPVLVVDEDEEIDEDPVIP